MSHRTDKITATTARKTVKSTWAPPRNDLYTEASVYAVSEQRDTGVGGGGGESVCVRACVRACVN